MNALMTQTTAILMLNVRTLLAASIVNAGMDIVDMVLIVKVDFIQHHYNRIGYFYYLTLIIYVSSRQCQILFDFCM